MATTQAQRVSLFNTLAELMGTEDAETLMEQLPPSGWDNVATKDDLKVLTATFTAGMAEMRVEFTNALAGVASELAETRVEFAAALAETRVEFAAALAETRVEFTNALAETNAAMQAGFAQAATERAEIIKSHARHLYVTVATIVLATISIWIALLAGPAGG